MWGAVVIGHNSLYSTLFRRFVNPPKRYMDFAKFLRSERAVDVTGSVLETALSNRM